MCDDLIPIGVEARPDQYPLLIVGCHSCYTFHQGIQIDEKTLLPSHFHYRSTWSSDVTASMGEFVDSVEKHKGPARELSHVGIPHNQDGLSP